MSEFDFATATADAVPSDISDEDPAARLTKLITGIGCEVLHDDRGTNLIRILWKGGTEIVSLPSARLRRYCVALHFAAFHQTPKSGVVRGAFDLLGAIADRMTAEQVNRRFARTDGDIWIDMGTVDGRALRVNEAGWDVVSTPPVLFRRAAHQGPLVVPSATGDAKRLLPFLNLATDDDQLLVLTWLVTAMVPDIAHPILLLHGPQGRAKSTMAKILRRLIDPSSLPTVNFSGRTKELTQILDQHAVPVFDNVTTLSQPTSDLLCQAATGGGFTKRSLYTNEEETIFTFKRPMILTAIPIPTAAPDFLDRALLIEPAEIPPRARRSEQAIWQRLDPVAGEILGGLLDVLTTAMSIVRTINSTSLPRMADFALWGEAASRALGYPDGKFLAAYERNVDGVVRDIVDANPVATAVIRFATANAVWDGTPTELWTLLRKFAGPHDPQEWPRSPSALGRRLKLVSEPLRQLGVEVRSYRTPDSRRERRITIRSVAAEQTGVRPPSVRSVRSVRGDVLRRQEGTER